MAKKVRIVKVPKYGKGGGTQMFGPHTPPTDRIASPRDGSFRGGNDPEIKIRKTLEGTTKENATLEAEKGETVITNLSEEGIPEFYHIGGKRHSRGGTPLNLPEDSFIFSRDRALALRDPELLQYFGKNTKKKKGFTPADLSKKFNLNNYREILADPDADTVDISTAELMIRNYNNKLGALALAQESVKGFDSGIPAVAISYMDNVGMDPESLISPESMPGVEDIDFQMVGGPTFQKGGEFKLPRFKHGGQAKRKVRITGLPEYQKGGEKATEWAKRKGAPWPDAIKDSTFNESTGMWEFDDGTPPMTHKAAIGLALKVKMGAPIPTQYRKTAGSKVAPRKTTTPSRPTPATNTPPAIPATRNKTGDGNGVPYTADKWDKEEGILELNRKRKSMGLPAITGDVTSDMVTAGITELQALTDATVPELEVDYMLNVSHKPTAKMEKIMKEKYGMKDLSKKALQDAVTAGTISKEDVREGYKDSKWHYRAITTDTKELSKEDYEAKMAEEGAIKQGDDLYFHDDPNDAGKYTKYVMKEPEPAEPAAPAAPLEHLPNNKPGREKAPFWTQDLVNMGITGANYFGIKKHLPWAGADQHINAEPHLVDFRTDAANIASQVRAGAQEAATFAGPQQMAARTADLNRKSVQGILKLQANERATNNQVLNKFELFNTRAENAFNEAKGQRNKEQYDRTIAVNNAFDNSKRKALQAFGSAYNTGLTNRGATQAANAINPDWQTDPTTGFVTRKDNPYALTGDVANVRTPEDDFREISARNKNLTPEEVLKLMRLNNKSPDGKGERYNEADQYRYPGQQT